jgi:hypothetical protein
MQISTGELFANGGISNTLIDVKRINPFTYIRRKALIDRLLWAEKTSVTANAGIRQWLGVINSAFGA